MSEGALTLALDTSAAHCAAALLSGDRLVDSRAEEMGRGQAERLIPLIEEMLADAGVTWRDLGRIGVGIGPGNFTGIRISVSAARGLALALDIPAIGVSGFDAISHGISGAHLPVLPAPRGMLYARPQGGEPCLMQPEEANATGLALAELPPAAELAEAIARVAAGTPTPAPSPAPLYVKPADAAPSRDAPPVMLD